MAKDLPGRREVGCHKHGRPNYRVEAKDVFADNLNGSWPERLKLRLRFCTVFAVTNGCDVVQ